MNKLVLSLLLACGVANAAEYWTTPTQQGGEIVLTGIKTDTCGDTLLSMYVITADRRVAYGCWALFNDRVLPRDVQPEDRRTASAHARFQNAAD
jgi:hypothetical protein